MRIRIIFEEATHPLRNSGTPSIFNIDLYSKKLLETSASLVVTSALLVVTKRY